MTIEEKAKAYDEAIKVAKNELKQDLHESGIWAIKRIFPELNESEDEQAMRIIRKRMCYDPVPISDEDRRIVEAWLEKQKEQKPVECINIEELAKHIKAEFESFRNLLKKKGIDYQPTDGYWTGYAYLFVSSAKKLQKPVEWSEEEVAV